tara:strand:- start:281 stop:451 length:171 start_codon:yes stop_codon:yes gene_type:complete
MANIQRKIKRLQHLRDTGQDKRADKKQKRMIKPLLKHILKAGYIQTRIAKPVGMSK